MFYCLGKGHIASYCPKKITMITQIDGEVGTDNKSEEEEEETPPLEDASDEEMGVVDGEALVLRRSLSIKIKMDDME